MNNPISMIFLLCCSAVLLVGVLFWLLQRGQKRLGGESSHPDRVVPAAPSVSTSFIDQKDGLTSNHFIKYSILMMGLQKLHKYYRDISTPQFMIWATSWLQPEFDLTYDPDSATLSLFILGDNGRQVLFKGDYRQFPAKDLISERIKNFTEEQSRMLVRGIDDYELPVADRHPIETAFFEADSGYTEEFESERIAKLQDLWMEMTSDLPVSHTFEDVKLLIKFMALATLLPLVETGRLNLALDTFEQWTLMWLYPDLLMLLRSQDPGAILLLKYTGDKPQALARTPLFHVYDSVHFAQQYALLSEEERKIVVEVTRQYIKLLPVPPVSNKEGKEANEEYSAIVEAVAVLSPPLKLAEKSTGIRMIDTSAAGSWYGTQLFKALLATIFLIEVKHGKTITPDVEHLVACANWCASWLQPHWELVVESKSDGSTDDDGVMTLYPLTEEGIREPCYYQGLISKFVSSESPIIRDAQRFDFSQRIIQLAQELRRRYGLAVMVPDGEIVGEGLVAIELNDPLLAEKVAFNDDYIFGFAI